MAEPRRRPRYFAFPGTRWLERWYLELSTDAKVVLHFLESGPSRSGMPGLHAVSPQILAISTNLATERVSAALEELRGCGLEYDAEASLFFLPHVAKEEDWPSNENVVKGWANALAELPRSTLVRKACVAMHAALSARNRYAELFRNRVESISIPYLNGFETPTINLADQGLETVAAPSRDPPEQEKESEPVKEVEKEPEPEEEHPVPLRQEDPSPPQRNGSDARVPDASLRVTDASQHVPDAAEVLREAREFSETLGGESYDPESARRFLASIDDRKRAKSEEVEREKRRALDALGGDDAERSSWELDRLSPDLPDDDDDDELFGDGGPP